MPASGSERKLALSLVVISAIFFAICLPFAKTPLLKVAAFIPIYACALCTNDAITALLLFGQFIILRSKAILVLALGYTFTALMTVAHALSFPGLFSATGLLGAGTQTTVWLYMVWHGGFPLFIIAYALTKNRARIEENSSAMLFSLAGIFVIVACVVFFATSAHDLLPVLLHDGHYTPTMMFTTSGIWLLSLTALLVLWRHRSHSVLDLWLLIVAGAWVFDIALSTIFNAARFDLGFYAGRVYGLIAASFVLWMLLIENTKLYAKLVIMHEQQLEKNAELEILNRDMESFGYSVSHDLRSPLLVIEKFALILEKEHAALLDKEGQHFVSVIRNNSTKMRALVEDLLAFSKLGQQSLQLELVRFDGLIDDIVRELKEINGTRQIQFNITALPPALADEKILHQVWWNLIENAVKYTRTKPSAVISIGYKESNPPVYFVEDNGVGFDTAYAHKLFNVFQRLHSSKEFEGSGVGLAIVERIVGKHGGRIWAESTLGVGSTFYFTLRAADPLNATPASI